MKVVATLRLANTHITDISDDLSVVHMVAQRGYGPSAKPRIRYALFRLFGSA